VEVAMRWLHGDYERPYAFSLAIAFLPLDLLTFPWLGFSTLPVSYLLGATSVALQATPSLRKARLPADVLLGLLFSVAGIWPVWATFFYAAQDWKGLAPLLLARAVEFVIALSFGWGVLAWLKKRRIRREHAL
jgi:hypothetical protein